MRISHLPRESVRARDVAQSAESLPSTHRTFAFIPEQHKRGHSALRKPQHSGSRQEDQKFKGILSCRTHLRLVWVTGDPGLQGKGGRGERERE